MILAIDDCAKCPCLGYIYICGVLVDKKELNKMRKKVVIKDSKITTPLQRKKVFNYVLHSNINCFIIRIKPKDIDKYNINDLEMQSVIRIMNFFEGKFDELQIDNFDVSLKKFEERFKKFSDFDLKSIKTKIEHNADVKYPAVSLASMICKYTEDEDSFYLKKHYGDFGSKNSNDKKTQEWIRNNKDNWLIRRSWGKIVPEILSD